MGRMWLIGGGLEAWSGGCGCDLGRKRAAELGEGGEGGIDKAIGTWRRLRDGAEAGGGMTRASKSETKHEREREREIVSRFWPTQIPETPPVWTSYITPILFPQLSFLLRSLISVAM